MPVIIFPLRNKLRGAGNLIFLQQRPRSTGGRRVVLSPVLPWTRMTRPPSLNFSRYDPAPLLSQTCGLNYGLCALNIKQPETFSAAQSVNNGTQPAVVHAIKPMPFVRYTLTGRTLDNTGGTLPFAPVDLYTAGDKRWIGSAVSEADGTYRIHTAMRQPALHFVVAYKPGSPDIAGITATSLQADT